MEEKNVGRKTVTTDDARTEWDAIVIGSGVGGLTAAAALAAGGKKVLVLEQHYVPGGYATCFRRKGFTFEVGLDATPSLGEGQLIHGILKELGVAKKFTAIPLAETMLIRTPRGELPMGPRYLEDLKGLFPGETKGIEGIESLMDRLSEEIEKILRLSLLPEPVYDLAGRFLSPTLHHYHRKTLAECLDEFVSDPLLRQLIAVKWGYFGLPLGRISAVLYLLGLRGFIREGVYNIKGTSQSLSNAFVERIEELGGRVLLRQCAEKILTKRARVTGVVTRAVRPDGPEELRELKARVVVSNANPWLTFEMTEEANLSAAYLETMNGMEKSISASMAYIGLDCPFHTLTGVRHHNVYDIDDTLDHEAAFRAKMEGRDRGYDGIIDHGLMDPTLAPEGKTCLSMIKLAFMRDWMDLPEEEYRRRKEEMKEEMLGAAEEKYPGFRSHIEVVEVATPRTMWRYTLNPGGSFNGFAYTPERVGMGKGGLDAQTPVNGLYLSSAWTGAISGGFYGCIATGFMTARTMLHTARWR